MRIFKVLVLVLNLAFLSSMAFAVEPQNPKFVIHLLDYLAKDYGGAVQNGKVISQGEYNEQVEFVGIIRKTSKELPEIRSQVQIIKNIEQLNRLVTSKADAGKVAALARQIQGEVIKIAKIEVSPTTWPNLERGKQLFAQSCTSCHGQEGRGDGLAGKSLDPKPANFLDEEWGENSHPFQSYNVIRFGVPGTGMAAFTNLSDEEVWSLAFYVNSLRWNLAQTQSPTSLDPVSNETLGLLASNSDKKLLSGLSQEKSPKAVLAYLRTLTSSQVKKDSLAVAITLLNQAFDEYSSGNSSSAKAKALQAYLEGVEPVENRIKANDPKLVVDIESRMSAVRGGIEKGIPKEELKILVGQASGELKKAQETIWDKPLSPTVNFFAAFFILLREGFEAVLIILALLGVTRAASSRKAENWIHGGWAAALGLGVLTWFFSGWVLEMSGAQREIMEGLISLFAVAVLLYVGFWLHRQTEIRRWTRFLNEKVKKALEGNKLIGLGLISFMAVFREAFETVLFLRALWLETGDAGKFSIFAGVISSLAVIFLLSWLALKLSRKLPLREFFVVSSAVMAFLAAVLTGKGFHALQEAGVVSITESPLNLRIDLIGIYPTFETIAPQILVVSIVFIVFHLNSRLQESVVKE